MGDLSRCIQAAVDSGKLRKDLAQEISESPDPQATINQMVGVLSKQKRDAALSAIALDRAARDVEGYEGNTYQALRALLTKDNKGKAKYQNVEYLTKYYEAQFHSGLGDMLSRFRTRTIGITQDKEGLRSLVKAMFGEGADDVEIGKFAKELAETFETIRAKFNSVGGSISKNQNWKLPPPGHNARDIKKIGLDTWKAEIAPMLDRNLMVADDGRMLSDAELDVALEYVYKTITTHGLHKAKDFTVPNMGTKLSSRGGEQRFLYFKDSDSWMSYNEKYGKGNIFTTLTDHINGMAHNIAMVERLGPNPEHTLQALRLMSDKADMMTDTQKTKLTAIWNVSSGKVNSGDMTTLADGMQATRNLVSAGILGSAFISSVTDLGFGQLTAHWNDISGFKVIARQMQLMNPGSEEARIFAVRLGLTADSMIDHAHAGNRIADTYGTGKTAKLSEGVIRLSGLAAWTDSGRRAFGIEFTASLADDFGKLFNKLSAKRIRRFESAGITSEDWDLFRSGTPLDFQGAKFADILQPGGEKFHQTIMQEMDFATPTPDVSVRAATTGGLGRATFTGQVVRAGMNLKTFPLTIMNTHMMRIVSQATGMERVQYIAALTVYTTLLGILAVQAKDLAAGRTPRPMDAKLFAAGFVQGGGLGLFGDLLFSDTNRFGGGIVDTMAGPYAGLVDQGTRLTLGNIQQAVKGEETNVLGESAEFLDRWAPDVWQTRLFSSAIADQVQLLVDPKAQSKFNRQIRKREKEYKQTHWWEPGEALPKGLQ